MTPAAARDHSIMCASYLAAFIIDRPPPGMEGNHVCAIATLFIIHLTAHILLFPVMNKIFRAIDGSAMSWVVGAIKCLLASFVYIVFTRIVYRLFGATSSAR